MIKKGKERKKERKEKKKEEKRKKKKRKKARKRKKEKKKKKKSTHTKKRTKKRRSTDTLFCNHFKKIFYNYVQAGTKRHCRRSQYGIALKMNTLTPRQCFGAPRTSSERKQPSFQPTL